MPQILVLEIDVQTSPVRSSTISESLRMEKREC